MSKEIISLLQLNQQISHTIGHNFAFPVWIRAEIAEFRVNQNGHCYLDLVEKSAESEQIVARSKAIIWAYTFRMLKPYFETSTGITLTSGLKVLVQVSVEFQEVFGLSLIIRDIDPAYTLGDLEQRKKEVIHKLKLEGVFDMNRELEFPVVAQRIAIISSPTAAGYEDFIHQLQNNRYGIKFYLKLFPAIMQGDNTPVSIIKSLDKIFEYSAFFDVVVIIRGGGASIDLISFDDYWLAYHIAQYPIPVLTGIGHERDKSVADLVAHSSLKTPTAVAEFLINEALQLLESINQYSESLGEYAKNGLISNRIKLTVLTSTVNSKVIQLVNNEKYRINRLFNEIPRETKFLFQKNKNKITGHVNLMKQLLLQTLGKEKNSLNEKRKQIKILSRSNLKHHKGMLLYFDKSNQLYNPLELLQRGYTLTYLDGKLIKDGHQLKVGNIIDTRFRDITVKSIVGEPNNQESE